ncbi:MAG: hypothetical protein IPH27_11715 [Actinomycetales bacterium]|nr:hypothetical protein [Candidatus Phosphoribacter baldrii]
MPDDPAAFDAAMLRRTSTAEVALTLRRAGRSHNWLVGSTNLAPIEGSLR